MLKNYQLSQIVSREAYQKLQEYSSLLMHWNGRVNLLSKKTTTSLLELHLIDCIDLALKIKEVPQKLYDIGSGSGLPGIVLSICGIKNITLVEVDFKKSVFLEEAKRILGLDIKIIRNRIEVIENENASVIVSRAMASCRKLLFLSKKLVDYNTEVLLMKSDKQIDEIEELKKDWDFKVEIIKNRFVEGHLVFHITKLAPKNNFKYFK